MALITRYVNTSSTAGGDGTTNNTTGATRAYASLSEWGAAEQTNLVTDTDQHKVICTGGADTTAVTVAGWTTSTTYTLTIEVAAGSEHDGVDPTTGYHFDVGHATALTISNSVSQINVTGVGFILKGNYSSAGVIAVNVAVSSSTDNKIINRCLAKDTLGYSTGGVFLSSYSGGTFSASAIQFRNCISISATGGSVIGFKANIQATVDNCTAVGAGSSDVGFSCTNTGSRTFTAHNCVAYGNGGASYTNVNGTGSSNNAADNATTVTPPGTSPYTSNVVSGDFVSTSTDDYHLASGSGLIGQGTNLTSTFTDDIDDDTRPSTGNWDIGFDHYVSAGTTITPTEGSYQYTGQAPIVNARVIITPNNAAISYAGQSPAINEAINIEPAMGSFAYLGQNPNLNDAINITPTNSVFNYSGQDPQVNAADVVTPDPGSFSYVGQAVTLIISTIITPAAAAFRYVGKTVIINGIMPISNFLLRHRRRQRR